MIKLLPCILFEKKTYLYFSIRNGHPSEPALYQLYRHTFVPYIGLYVLRTGDSVGSRHVNEAQKRNDGVAAASSDGGTHWW